MKRLPIIALIVAAVVVISIAAVAMMGIPPSSGPAGETEPDWMDWSSSWWTAPAPGANSSRVEAVTISISYTGHWTLGLVNNGSLSTMEGNGSWSRTLDRPNASMWWIAAGAQKHDKGSDMLTLAVASGGINLAQKFATSKYGVATLAWQNKVGPSEPDPIPDPTPDPTPTALSFTGSTDTVTSSFRLASGIAIFSMTYSGSGHFAIWLKNAITGAQEELLANEIEAYNGSVLVSVTDSLSAVHPGMYYLEVTADASWRIQGRQPVSASASSLPVTLTGQTDSVPSPVWLTPGAVRFQMSYTGTDLFSIVLYGSDGEYVDLLVNRIGTCSGAASVSITSAGSYYLAVNGIGSWSITVTHL